MAKKYNLRKLASDIEIITDKAIEDNRDDMYISNKKSETTEKNINLSLPIKNKDNTIPYNVQLEATRKNEKDQQIIEAKMSKEEVAFGAQKDSMTDINAETKKHVDKAESDYKKAEGSSKSDTEFWDKYVGLDLEGDGNKKVKNLIPEKASQLPNVSAEVEAVLRDADAMIYHIYATAYSQNRNINDTEKQQLIDIEGGKARYLASKMIEPIKRSLPYGTEKKKGDKKSE